MLSGFISFALSTKSGSGISLLPGYTNKYRTIYAAIDSLHEFKESAPQHNREKQTIVCMLKGK